jgi:hypothetical protein
MASLRHVSLLASRVRTQGVLTPKIKHTFQNTLYRGYTTTSPKGQGSNPLLWIGK